MNVSAYVQSDVAPLLALAALLVNARRRLPATRTNVLFRIGASLAAIDLCLDMGCALLAGERFVGSVEVAWALNLAFYVVGGLASLCWYLFVRSSTHEHDPLAPREGRNAAAVAAYLVYAAALLSSPWTHAIFTIDADGRYVRGPLFAVIFAFSLAYALVASAEALARRRRATDPAERVHCLYLASFPVPMVCAGILQICFGDVSFLVPGLALSILLVYFDLQRVRMVRDGLTGLYNRGRFDQHLEELCAPRADGRPWCLVMIDIDDFKAVNDEFGHAVGDRVLRQVAELLRKTFRRERELVARYGGDEFAVVIDGAEPEQVEERLSVFDAALERASVPCGPSRLGASAGVAFMRERTTPEEALRRADAAMYERKQAKKANR